MNKTELVAHFNKHFRNQNVIVCDNDKNVKPHLGRFNPVIDAFNIEAKKYNMDVRYIIEDDCKTDDAGESKKGAKKESKKETQVEAKQENRLTVYIEKRHNLHCIRAVLNF